MYITGLAVVAAGLFAIPALAGGTMVEAQNGAATVARETTVDGGAFLAGNSVAVDGVVKGDVYCSGNDITIRGTVEGDVLCAGNTITVAGTVKGDVRVAANTVTLEGTVEGAVSAAASVVTVSKSATVGSDIIAWASNLKVDGTVGRDVKGYGATVTLAGAVGRDADIVADRVTVNEGGLVSGHLVYTSNHDATIAQDSVKGDVSRITPPQHEQFGSSGQTFSTLILTGLATIVFMAALTLFIVLVMPKYVRRATDTSWRGFLVAALVGIFGFVVALPLVLLAMLSVVGVMIGVFLIVAFVLMSLLAGPLVAYYIGKWVFAGRSQNMLVVALIGSILVGIAAIIPVLGVIAAAVGYFAGLGLVILSLKAQFESGYRTLETEPVVAVRKDTVEKKTKTTKR